MSTPVDTTAQQTSGVRFPPPLIYVAGILLGWLLERTLPLSPIDELWSAILSTFCFIVGAGLVSYAMGLFRLAGTNPLPMRPTTALVLRGPYRFTRNPMYLGMAFLYAGTALLFDLRWALILLPLVLFVVQTQVIAREERYLEAKFGDEYRAYRARVRRWL